MGQYSLLDRRDHHERVVDAVNRLVKRDAGLDAESATAIRWTRYGGTDYTQIIRNTAGKHRATLLAATSPTAAPTSANAVEIVDDAGLSIGAGKVLRLYETGGVDYAELVSADGLLTLGGSGANAGQLDVLGLTSEGALTLKEIATPGNPAATYQKLYGKTGLIARLTSAGVESRLLDASQFTAAGQLISSSASNTALLIAAGTTVQRLLGGAAPAWTSIVPTLLADNTYGSLHAGTAITAVTETDVTSNLSFTVASASSLIGILVRGYAQCTMALVGAATARLRLDSAGANTLYSLSGGRVQVANEFVNIFDGAGPVLISGLAAGAHTIKVRIYTENNGNLYMRANGVESLNVTVVEYIP